MLSLRSSPPPTPLPSHLFCIRSAWQPAPMFTPCKSLLLILFFFMEMLAPPATLSPQWTFPLNSQSDISTLVQSPSAMIPFLLQGPKWHPCLHFGVLP